MKINGSTRTRQRRPNPTELFLGAYPHARPVTPEEEANELNEDDIFSTGNSSPPRHHQPSPSSSASSTPRHHHHKAGFPFPEPSGILAALPKHHTTNSHFYQKPNLSSSTASSSSSTSSSSRFIPKPPQDRVRPQAAAASPFSRLHPQSAPVNVPVLSTRMGSGNSNSRRRGDRDFDEIGEDELDDAGDGGEMLPPHEMVARAHTPAVACSVLEGVGRTLKGRDLRQVRNAVWRRTGFLD